jgi:imidazolonepropionase-like amidohydrolase/Tol biopolymer transport system component
MTTIARGLAALALLLALDLGMPAHERVAAAPAGQDKAQPTPSSDEKEKNEKDKKTSWDITQPLGPSTSIDFETDEGTWMNVDVSPDGREIVFDLLGDIYVMPAAGSGTAAERITSGAAFDMQPRFSPDGKLIAYTSDAGGLWNVWVMQRDGSGARQVSEEKRWFVNSPAWSPDGQYIYARHHFVKERSLGAGEIWMYHVSGGPGLQVTEKNGWQKDAGEPALSPDGRYLYYSKDLTPGQRFEYDKDPYNTIYGIIRRDLGNGRERTIADRPGGSITPRISPDGRTLAFIRRVRLKTVLFTRELATGIERPVWDGLERDMQEAWAVHGVYPQYAWMPDGQALVIWAQGHIWRVDAQTGAAAMIPFRARVQQTAYAPLRFPQDVHPARVPIRMLRHVTTSRDGSRVAYSALGRIYVKSMPDGTPLRITCGDASGEAGQSCVGEDETEAYPAISPDGRAVAYTSWSDARGGRVKVVPAGGGTPRDIVTTPGHYVETAFSPDGRTVAYRATTGDGVRGPEWGTEPGLFVVSADGSTPPRLVREAGYEPQFDHTGTRLYFRDRRDDKFVLASVELSGADEQVHFRSENATQIVPSPDGRWVAFAERYHAFVAAFPRSGRPVDLGPSVTAFPVTRVSRDAGLNLHWSGDSRRVHWTLGPDYFTRDLGRTFTFLDAKLEKADEPEVKGVSIGFEADTDVPTGAIVLEGARIVPMAGTAGRGGPAGVIERGTIVIDRNRIAAIGPSGSVKVLAGATRIDVSGKTIIPGLIDVHGHVGGEDEGIIAQTNWQFAANLAYGVTTSHDPSNDTETVFTNAELIRTGAKLGPRLFSTGTILYGAETPFKAVVENYDEALAHLRRMKAVGAFSVKSYNQQRRDARQMILKAARELEMEVVPEGGSLVYMNETMVLDGHTGVEHALPVPAVYKDVVTLFAKSGTGYTPTLIVAYGGLNGENYWYQHQNVWENTRLLTFTPRDVIDPRSRRRPLAAEDDFNHVRVAKAARKIRDAGTLVLLGAHGQLQGLGAHWELWMLAQGGLSALEALACGTIDAARYLGFDKDIGSLEPGKLADLVVLDRNPLQDLRTSDSVALVMKNGRLYDAATLNEIGNHKATRRPFYWEVRSSERGTRN